MSFPEAKLQFIHAICVLQELLDLLVHNFSTTLDTIHRREMPRQFSGVELSVFPGFRSRNTRPVMNSSAIERDVNEVFTRCVIEGVIVLATMFTSPGQIPSGPLVLAPSRDRSINSTVLTDTVEKLGSTHGLVQRESQYWLRDETVGIQSDL